MRAAPSVLIFTVTAGLGQGFFVALLLSAYLAAQANLALPASALALGGLICVVLLGVGLAASFFHLGHPLRAWRAASMWRTSWLSREVIVLPLTMAMILAWSVAVWMDWSTRTALAGLAFVATLVLWLCTAMIYACLRFLQEWAHPVTVLNFVLIGLASGFTLNAFYWSLTPAEVPAAIPAALLTLIAACAVRLWSLHRNAGLKAKSSAQSALGINHPKIAQKSQGAMGGSFNTREYFHGKTLVFVVRARAIMLTLGFVLPAALCLATLWMPGPWLIGIAVLLQYIGLLTERWVFFAQAKHPQNIYYQVVS